MILGDFVKKNMKSFRLCSHGEIEFFDKIPTVVKEIGHDGHPFNKIEIKRALVGSDNFDSYFDLIGYYSYTVIDSRIDVYTKYSFKEYQDDIVESFIYLKVYGKKITQNKIFEKMDEL